MLKLTLGRTARESRIELNGVDVSTFFRSVVLRAGVEEATIANMEYSGAVVVEMEGGHLALQQAMHFVKCDACDTVLRGEARAPEMIRVTAFGESAHRHEQAPTARQDLPATCKGYKEEDCARRCDEGAIDLGGMGGSERSVMCRGCGKTITLT
jgi:hypothetical protein